VRRNRKWQFADDLRRNHSGKPPCRNAPRQKSALIKQLSNKAVEQKNALLAVANGKTGIKKAPSTRSGRMARDFALKGS